MYYTYIYIYIYIYGSCQGMNIYQQKDEIKKQAPRSTALIHVLPSLLFTGCRQVCRRIS